MKLFGLMVQMESLRRMFAWLMVNLPPVADGTNEVLMVAALWSMTLISSQPIWVLMLSL